MTRQFVSAVADHGDRGREFGSVHAERVGATVSAYRRIFSTDGPVDLDELGARALHAIDGFAPELGEEIRGIAEGAGLPATHVAAINARTEILALLGLETKGECSTVVVLNGRGHEPVAMQTWDWYVDMADNWLEWTIPFPDGRRLTTVTEYGIVGKIGVNAYGVGLHFNILHHRDDGAGIGVPVHVLARRILETAPDVKGGLLACAEAAVSASTSITLVGSRRAGKTAVSVELYPGGPGHVLPEPYGVLVHTNHFLSEPGRFGDEGPSTGPDTLIRYDVLRRALWPREPQPDPVTADGLLEVMTDHTGGVCCHPDPRSEPLYATLATVRLDVGNARVVTTADGPCAVG